MKNHPTINTNTKTRRNEVLNYTIFDFLSLKFVEGEGCAGSTLLYQKSSSSKRNAGKTQIKIPNPRIISSSKDETVKVWDFETGSLLHTMKGHSDKVYSCSISVDNRLVASASRDKTVKVWDADSGILLRTLKGHTSQVNSCAISADCRLIVSGSNDRSVRIWNAETGQCINTLTHHAGSVYSCCISSDSKLIVSASRTFIRTYHVTYNGTC